MAANQPLGPNVPEGFVQGQPPAIHVAHAEVEAPIIEAVAHPAIEMVQVPLPVGAPGYLSRLTNWAFSYWRQEPVAQQQQAAPNPPILQLPQPLVQPAEEEEDFGLKDLFHEINAEVQAVQAENEAQQLNGIQRVQNAAGNLLGGVRDYYHKSKEYVGQKREAAAAAVDQGWKKATAVAGQAGDVVLGGLGAAIVGVQVGAQGADQVLKGAIALAGYAGALKFNQAEYLDAYRRKLDVNGPVEAGEARVKAAIPDSQFLEFTRFLQAVLTGKLSNELNIPIPVIGEVKLKKELVESLIKINLATGFANLAETLGANRDEAQNPLANLITLLAKKVDHVATADKLEKFETAYFKHTELRKQLESLFIKDAPRAERLINELLTRDSEGQFPNEEETEITLRYLLADDFDKLSPENQAKIKEFIASGRALQQHQEVFNDIAKEVLNLLFPNKINDIILPGMDLAVAKSGYIQKKIFSAVEGIIADLLIQTYIPTRKSPEEKQALLDSVKAQVGVDVAPLLQAPAAFLTKFVEAFIETNPDSPNLIQTALDQANKVDEIIPGHGNTPLAHWLLDSLKDIVHSNDPAMARTGNFTKGIMADLTLYLVSKGATHLMDKKPVGEGQFLKEFIELGIKKFQTVKEGDVPTKQFWDTFLKDAPLPSFIKDLLVTKIMERITPLKGKEVELKQAREQAEILYNASLAIVKGYPKGDHYIALTGTIATKILAGVSKSLESPENLGGFADQMEALFAEYMPGVKIDKALKDWLKANISKATMGMQGDSLIGSTFKKAIQAVLLNSIIKVVNDNFNGNAEQFSANILKKIHEGFTKSFGTFSAEDKQKLMLAVGVQSKLASKVTLRDELQKEVASLNADLLKKDVDVLSLIKESIQLADKANQAVIRRDGYLNQLNGHLAKLNENLVNWNPETLDQIENALIFQKQQNLPSDFAFLHGVRIKIIERLADPAANNLNEQQVTGLRNSLAHYVHLIELKSAPEETLKIIQQSLSVRLLHKVATQEVVDLYEAKAVNLAALQAWQVPGKDELLAKKDDLISKKQELKQLDKEITELEIELDQNLNPFKAFANEISGIIGIESNQAFLPAQLREKALPMIQNAKDHLVARFLFEQLAPLLRPLYEMEANREKLKAATGSYLLPDLATVIAKEVMAQASNVITYKPAADIFLALPLVGTLTTDEECNKLNSAVDEVLKKLGKIDIDAVKMQALFSMPLPVEVIDKLVILFKEDGLTFEKAKEILLAHVPEENEINKFLLKLDNLTVSLGKKYLRPRHLRLAYEKAIPGEKRRNSHLTGSPRTADALLEASKVINKMTTDVYISESMSASLNEALPGILELHPLVAPQLKAIVRGEDVSIQNTHKRLQQYIESIFLNIFQHFVEKNGNVNILEKVSIKLKEIMSSEAVAGLEPAEASQVVADAVLKEILGIKSEKDLIGIPPVLQKLGFDIIKKEFSVLVGPYILPLLNRKQDKAELLRISKSPFLGNFCEAIAKDITSFIAPMSIQSYEAVAQKIYQELAVRAEDQPTPAKIKSLAGRIAKLNSQAGYSSTNKKPITIKNKLLLEAYLQVEGVEPNKEERKVLLGKLKKANIKHDVGALLVTPQEIIDSIVKSFPNIGPELHENLVKEFHKLTRFGSVPTDKAYTDIAQKYFESLLYKVFINIAKKNEPAKGKDVTTVFIEKALGMLEGKIGEVREKIDAIQNSRDSKLKTKNDKDEAIQKVIERAAGSLSVELINKVLGIESQESFEGMPPAIQNLLYDIVKNQVTDLVKNLVVHSFVGFKALENTEQENIDAKANLKNLFGETWATTVSEDLGKLLFDCVLGLNVSVGGSTKGAALTGEGSRNYLESLLRDNVHMAGVLLDSSRHKVYRDIAAKEVHGIGEMSEKNKAKAAEMLGNFLVKPLNEGFSRLLKIEDDRQAEFNNKLIVNMMNVLGSHLRTVNQAKLIAAHQRGKENFTHADFIAASEMEGGVKLHPATPKTNPTYQASIEEIITRLKINGLTIEQRKTLKEAIIKLVDEDQKLTKVLRPDDLVPEIQKALGRELSETQIRNLTNRDSKGFTIKDTIRREAEANALTEAEHFHNQTTKKLLKSLFPNGKNDLTFVAPELRSTVWRLLKKQLPTLMASMIETFIDQDNITTMVINSLDKMVQNLKTPPEDVTALPDNRPLDELDKACGEVVFQMIDMTKLPQRIRDQIIIDGKINPMIQKSLGGVLRDQFNHDFMRRTLKIGLEKLATDRSILKKDMRPENVREAEAIKLRKKKEQQLKKLTEETVDTSIRYGIQNLWGQSAIKKFDRVLDSWFARLGTIGVGIKKTLDAVLGFVFYTCLSALISVVFYPIKPWIKKKLYDYINLEENTKIVMNVLRAPTVDQPGPTNFAAHSKDLVFKMIGALDDALSQSPPPVAAA